jgi:hypothetical protein
LCVKGKKNEEVICYGISSCRQYKDRISY